MAFITSGQETEWALFLQPRRPHGALRMQNVKMKITLQDVKHKTRIHETARHHRRIRWNLQFLHTFINRSNTVDTK